MLYGTCFTLAPVGSSSAGKSFMHACDSQAFELVMTTREAVILTEALINVNF